MTPWHHIQQIDTRLFVWLNGLHAPWADGLMALITARNTWIPAYVLLLCWLFWTYKQQTWSMMLRIVLTVVVADQGTSSFLKPMVQRLRPCHVEYLQGRIHQVTDCGGNYGFASSHAANSFGLAMILWLMLGQRHGWLRWVFLWAFGVSYSRIYVGVHYPLDVVVGALMGIWGALMVQHCFKFAANRI